MSGINSNPNPQDWLYLLQDEGYRITKSRKAVIEVVANSHYVISPLDVFEQARQEYPGLGLVTVYRTMDKLTELGLIQRVHQPSGCRGFVPAFTGHQHLLICERCGKVEFFNGDEEGIKPLLASVEAQSGYQIKSHWLQFFGLCKNCQQAEVGTGTAEENDS